MFAAYVRRRLIELSVYLVITESIMSTFHASSLALFRQVRFFIGSRDVWLLGYSVRAPRYSGLYYLCSGLKEFTVAGS